LRGNPPSSRVYFRARKSARKTGAGNPLGKIHSEAGSVTVQNRVIETDDVSGRATYTDGGGNIANAA
jgi:hypothetical protein